MSLINGKMISLEKLSKSFDELNLIKKPLSHILLYETFHKISEKINSDKVFKNKLVNCLVSEHEMEKVEAESSITYLLDFISEDNLRIKIKREFKTEHPFELKRISMKDDMFEAYYPLGVIFHLTPSNSPMLSTLALIEGLLSGSVNVLKLSSRDSNFSLIFFEELIKLDLNNILKNYIYILQFSSKDKETLRKVISRSDVVSAWGNEETIEEIKKLIPNGIRLLEWGHKISFIYKTKKVQCQEVDFEKLAFEICNNEQLACSSPQCIFLEDESFEGLKEFGLSLEKALIKYLKANKFKRPIESELAEVTINKELHRLEQAYGKALLIENNEFDFRIFIDDKEGISASPLYRSIWLRKIKSKNIIETLRPLKKYLQTVGLVGHQEDVGRVAQDLFAAGIQRINQIGEMTSSYVGEPHDGEYTLTRFCQKVSLNLPEMTKGIVSLEDNEFQTNQVKTAIMTKADFQNMKVKSKYSDLFFHSGGSSGEPKLSVFTYDDYHRQMEVAAEGLYAAGLDPKNDRCMNLFYAGNLYGGFISFFTILEKMEAVHFPMGGSSDFTAIGKCVVKNEVNTILGMPSFVMQLFNENKEIFKKNKSIKKVFFGGEHMSLLQKKYLMDEFGVEIIRSASYGSVDAGPLGFQCEFSTGSVHHLHSRLHSLEVVDLEKDLPRKNGEVGRLLFTSKVRHGQKIARYEIGDIGKIIDGKCSCGREGIRFELLGRTGDVFRVGTIFFSYQKFQKTLSDLYAYDGLLQVIIESNGHEKDQLLIQLEDKFSDEEKALVLQNLIENYSELNEVYTEDKVLDFKISFIDSSQFIFNQQSKKLKTVIDRRLI